MPDSPICVLVYFFSFWNRIFVFGSVIIALFLEGGILPLMIFVNSNEKTQPSNYDICALRDHKDLSRLTCI